MSEQCPANVSKADWEFYQRFLRHEAELKARSGPSTPTGASRSSQFVYVPGDSEAAVEAVIPK